MNIVLATTNPHKIDEMGTLLAGTGLQLLSLANFDIIEAPEENALTFAGNARIKAIAYAKATGVPALADDSGICIDALGDAPGVHSARWAGPGSGAAEWIAKTLEMLAGVPDSGRGARYVCAFCLAFPDGTVVAESEGTFEGRIAHSSAGDGGFGYDPIFLIGPDFQQTAAQITAEQKNAVSHRGVAARRLIELLSKSQTTT